MSIIISSYSDNYRLSVLAFFEASFAEMGFIFDIETKDKDLDDIASSYKKDGGGFLFAYDDEISQIVGTIGLRVTGKDYLELKRYFTLQNYQGMGVGKELLMTAINYAETVSSSYVRLDTSSKSTAAIHLFKKYGFYLIEKNNDDPYAEYYFEYK